MRELSVRFAASGLLNKWHSLTQYFAKDNLSARKLTKAGDLCGHDVLTQSTDNCVISGRQPETNRTSQLVCAVRTIALTHADSMASCTYFP